MKIEQHVQETTQEPPVFNQTMIEKKDAAENEKAKIVQPQAVEATKTVDQETVKNAQVDGVMNQPTLEQTVPQQVAQAVDQKAVQETVVSKELSTDPIVATTVEGTAAQIPVTKEAQTMVIKETVAPPSVETKKPQKQGFFARLKERLRIRHKNR